MSPAKTKQTAIKSWKGRKAAGQRGTAAACVRGTLFWAENACLRPSGEDPRPEDAGEGDSEAEQVGPAAAQEGLQEPAERAEGQDVDAEAGEPFLRPRESGQTLRAPRPSPPSGISARSRSPPNPAFNRTAESRRPSERAELT